LVFQEYLNELVNTYSICQPAFSSLTDEEDSILQAFKTRALTSMDTTGFGTLMNIFQKYSELDVTSIGLNLSNKTISLFEQMPGIKFLTEQEWIQVIGICQSMNSLAPAFPLLSANSVQLKTISSGPAQPCSEACSKNLDWSKAQAMANAIRGLAVSTNSGVTGSVNESISFITTISTLAAEGEQIEMQYAECLKSCSGL
jgi:hypothetical protein